DGDCIEGPFHDKGVSYREEPRGNPEDATARDRLSDQPYSAVLLLCKPESIVGELVDPGDIDILESYSLFPEFVRQDHKLNRRIDPLHIIGWICLCISHLPRLEKRLLVGKPLIGHPGEDEITCPVQD